MLQGLRSFSDHILFKLKLDGDPIILEYTSLYHQDFPAKVSKSHQLYHGDTKVCSYTLRQFNFILFFEMILDYKKRDFMWLVCAL